MKKPIIFAALMASAVFTSCSNNADKATATIGKSDTVAIAKADYVTPKPSYTPEEAHALSRQGALIVDVRDPDELAEMAYDVKDIKNIPVGELENHLSEIPKDRQVIVVCRSGGRSGRAFDLLKAKGFTNVANMDGGMNAWEEAGLPTLKDGAKSTMYGTAQKTRLEVYCFHGTRQCETCKNIKANTREALDRHFSGQLKDGNITFAIIDVDDKKNEQLAEKFEATGTALMINYVVNGKDSIVDWSDFAFDEAGDKDKYVALLKSKIEGVLK